MRIHQTSYLSGGTHGKSLRAKQSTPRSLLDGVKQGFFVLPPHHRPPPIFVPSPHVKNIDTNVNATTADVAEATIPS
jgi:hypothetical protein